MVDAGLVELLTRTIALAPWIARVPSFLLATLCTWQINRHWTFADRRGRTATHEFGLFLLSAMTAGTVNYLVFLATLAIAGLARQFPSLGVAAGSLAGLAVSFTLSRRVVFKPGGGRS